MDLRTLGGLMLEGSPLRRPKPLLLLAYLALEGAKPRRHLADLFYGHTADSFNSLSKALSIIRKAASDVLVSDPHQVASTLSCDAATLLVLLDTQQLEAATDLYEPFLKGAELSSLSAELENWVYGTREYLGKLVREALLRLGEQEAALGRHAAAAHFAERALGLPGAAELEPEDFPRLYRLLRAGRSFRAAEVRRDAHELGISLDSRMSLSSFHAVPEDTGFPTNNLPNIKTSFVGRERELRDLTQQLALPECRILTLHGPGGVGKSRLALQAARTLLRDNSFSSAIQIDLSALSSPEQLPSSLAEALDMTLQGQADPLSQVIARLGKRACLLLLDNFEQALEGVFVPVALTEACPGVTVLVTSRERLKLAEEWVYGLSGLFVPSVAGPTEELRAADAVSLFVQRAKRIRLDFAPTPLEIAKVLRICQLVEGFPLAIELAATWVRLLSCAEIAEALAEDMTLLATSARNVPERQWSMQAVLAQSWQRLSPDEQRVLGSLAVFRGGFRKEAAQAVAGATLPLLAALVDKALLESTPTGRFHRHLMLYQYTRERLAADPDEQAAAEARHAAYYHRLLASVAPELHGARPQAATGVIDEELGNLQLAWYWSIRHEDATALQQAAIPLRVFFDRQGRFQEGLDLFVPATEALHQDAHAEALGTLLVEQAWLYFRRGNRAEATQRAEKGLALLRPLQDRRGVIEGLHILGASKFYAGALVQARQDWTEALGLAQTLDDHEVHARTLDYLGVVEEHLGNYQGAYRYHQASLALSRQLDNKARVVTVLNNSGALALLTDRADEAAALLKEGLELARDIEAKQDIPYLLNNLARAAVMQADYEQAEGLGREALSLVQETGESWLEAKVWVETFGPLALALGDAARAHDAFIRCLAVAKRMKADHIVVQALLGLAEVYSNLEPRRAARILAAVLKHPASSPLVRKDAQELLDGFTTRLSPDLLHEAREPLGTASTDALIDQLLATTEVDNAPD